jgi:DNA primase
VSEKRHLAATFGGTDPASLRTGQDWTSWLRRAHCAQPPSTPPSADRVGAAWNALIHLARREGFTVERANCADADGFTTWRNRKVRIRPNLELAQAVTALAHQLGHVLLHSQIAQLEPSSTVPCTGVRKVEADSVAYLTASSIGIDTPPITFPHVSSWAGTDPRARPATTIENATSRIIAAMAAIAARLDAEGATRAEPVAPAPVGTPVDQHAGQLVPSEELVRVHDSAALFFRDQMPESWVPGYLAGRGLNSEVQDRWLAGYAPAEWDALICHLRTVGYSDTVIEAAGLARRSRRGTLIDTFRDRAMLPIRSADGTIIAFIGRAPDHADPNVPKYLNSPSTALYHKGDVFFGLWEAHDALASGARPVIVEGPLDAIAVTTAGGGCCVGVAPCGTALTAHQVAVLADVSDLRTTGVTVAFDPDLAGRRAAVHAYHLLVPLTEKMMAVTLPAGQDPAQILADSGPAALAEILTSRPRPLPDLVINAEAARWSRWLRHPEGQIHALRAAAPLIAAMPPAHIARQVARLAAILRLDHAIVTEAVTDALTTLAATPAERTRRDAAAQHTDLHAQAFRVIRAAGHESPGSAQQATKQVAIWTQESAPDRPAGAEQPQLPTRRMRS